MENEIWKDIIGYENLYQISSLGRVKSLGNGGSNASKERILKYGNVRGYHKVTLCKQGKQKHFFVHRLVAMTFLPNPDNLSEVNHRDEQKTNNCISNLEWVTHKENSNYGTRNERIGKLHSIIKIGNQYANKPIVQYDLNYKIIGIWESIKQASEILGINNSNITQCLKGKYKTAKGYKWKYLQDFLIELEKKAS